MCIFGLKKELTCDSACHDYNSLTAGLRSRYCGGEFGRKSYFHFVYEVKKVEGRGYKEVDQRDGNKGRGSESRQAHVVTNSLCLLYVSSVMIFAIKQRTYTLQPL